MVFNYLCNTTPWDFKVSLALRRVDFYNVRVQEKCLIRYDVLHISILQSFLATPIYFYKEQTPLKQFNLIGSA